MIVNQSCFSTNLFWVAFIHFQIFTLAILLGVVLALGVNRVVRLCGSCSHNKGESQLTEDGCWNISEYLRVTGGAEQVTSNMTVPFVFLRLVVLPSFASASCSRRVTCQVEPRKKQMMRLGADVKCSYQCFYLAMLLLAAHYASCICIFNFL